MSHSGRRDVSTALDAWLSDGRSCVLATVVSTDASAPRGVGAQLAIADGEVWTGGLSGGCAEVAVLVAARDLVDGGGGPDAATLLTMRKDTLVDAGPLCGATLEVLVERVDATLVRHLDDVASRLQRGEPVAARRTYAAGGDATSLHRVDASCTGESAGVEEPRDGAAGPHEPLVEWTSWEDGRRMLAEHLPPPPRLVACGGGDVATELLGLAHQVGWRTVLVDPRPAFADHTLARTPVDELVRAWPGTQAPTPSLDAATACVATAHDDRLDLPFLASSLQSPAFHVAAVGSRATHAARVAALADLVPAAALTRLRGPAGLDLGGSCAAEIALSVLAEAVAAWHGRSGAPLASAIGPIRASR